MFVLLHHIARKNDMIITNVKFEESKENINKKAIEKSSHNQFSFDTSASLLLMKQLILASVQDWFCASDSLLML